VPVIAAATGMAAIASSPSKTETGAARFRGRPPLLLDVGTANGGWGNRAADQAGDGD
jgi:hypothetical protein